MGHLIQIGSYTLFSSKQIEAAIIRQRFPCKRLQNFQTLIGMDGVKYANTLHGASDTNTFLQFFTEAAEADSDAGPVLAAGDIVVVDNAPIHHHRARQILTFVFTEYRHPVGVYTEVFAGLQPSRIFLWIYQNVTEGTRIQRSGAW